MQGLSIEFVGIPFINNIVILRLLLAQYRCIQNCAHMWVHFLRIIIPVKGFMRSPSRAFIRTS